MTEQKNNSMTIDDLALMVKRGFDQAVTKDDLKRFATKDDLRALERKMDAGFFAVNSRIDLLRGDISDLPDIREEVRSIPDMDGRLMRVERKVGFAR